MNKLKIGEIIFNLRKEKNITQEQLARMVGVSAGAVSKWETGVATPDISLLSPLVRALNTILEVLLSFQQDLSEDQIKNIKQELTEIFLKTGFRTGELKCKEYLKEYPNSIGLKVAVSTLIHVYCMLEDMTSDRIQSSLEDVLSQLTEVVKAKEPKYQQPALFMKANIHLRLGNFEECEKALKEMSGAFLDPTILYISLYQEQKKTEEARKLCESMLLQNLNQCEAFLSILARMARNGETKEDPQLYLNALNQMENTFQIGLASGALHYCKYYMQAEKMELAAEWFKKYVEDLLGIGYDYSQNPYFKTITLELNQEGQKIVRQKLIQDLLEDEELKSLSGIPKYEQAIDLLKKEIS